VEKAVLPERGRRGERAAAFAESIEKTARLLGEDGLAPETLEILTLIDTAGVLDFRKRKDVQGRREAAGRLKKTIAEFASFLYSLVRAMDER
jgi:hypothetical protein